jgi:hypothetical protein
VDDISSQIRYTTGAGHLLDLLAAHISEVEAYDVEGDVREINIPTFEPDLSTSFDDPVPWDVMPTGISDIPTQTYRLISNQQSDNYVGTLRTYSVAKSNASQPESNP